jgi:hypothetical protein
MSNPGLKKVRLEDLQNAPTWVDPLVEAVNRTTELLNAKLDGGISLADDIAGTLKTVDLRTGADYTSGEFPAFSFRSELSSKVNAVEILQVIDRDAPDAVLSGPYSADWREQSGQVTVRRISGLDASKRFRVRLHVW